MDALSVPTMVARFDRALRRALKSHWAPHAKSAFASRQRRSLVIANRLAFPAAVTRCGIVAPSRGRSRDVDGSNAVRRPQTMCYPCRDNRVKSSSTAWINIFRRGSCPLGVAASRDSR